MKDQETTQALTIQDPWAQAIFFGSKRVENRGFRWHGAPGWLVVCVGKTYDDDYSMNYLYEPREDHHFPGRMLGLVYIEECIHVDEKRARTPWAHGPVQWIIKHAFAFPPKDRREVRGMPGLFRVPLVVMERSLEPGVHGKAVSYYHTEGDDTVRGIG